ncbi:MAG: hypothetical protein ABI779_25840 [Acidobacteriota bacterium]
MRRISLALVFLIALAAVPLTADPVLRNREERRPLARFVRIVKSILGVQTNGDGLTPPLPTAPRP